MADIRTAVTELVTGLGTLGYATVAEALAARPSQMASVSPEQWQQLDNAFDGGALGTAFEASFANGQAMLAAYDGLRERRPGIIEWKGGQQNPGDDSLPVDLRIDHVFLISCKYDSKVLHNSSPTRLFDHALRRVEGPLGNNWYDEVAPAEYQALYAAAAQRCAQPLPQLAGDLTTQQRILLKESLTTAMWSEVRDHYALLCEAVSLHTAQRWQAVLTTKRAQEEFLWRVLRMGPAPYFILGNSPEGPIRIRIATPWDWRQQFEFKSLRLAPLPGGQPMVSWQATVRGRHSGTDREVGGFVEIRWGHGRFSAVEAKLKLTTMHNEVPGYFALT